MCGGMGGGNLGRREDGSQHGQGLGVPLVLPHHAPVIQRTTVTGAARTTTRRGGDAARV
jgi:hypothetical protein